MSVTFATQTTDNDVTGWYGQCICGQFSTRVMASHNEALPHVQAMTANPCTDETCRMSTLSGGTGSLVLRVKPALTFTPASMTISNANAARVLRTVGLHEQVDGDNDPAGFLCGTVDSLELIDRLEKISSSQWEPYHSRLLDIATDAGVHRRPVVWA